MEVHLDFHADVLVLAERALVANGAVVGPGGPHLDAVYRYYAHLRRLVEQRCYRVLEAAELVCPPQFAAGYAQLKNELENGIDVTARLSTRITKPAYKDMLLNDWGVTHFHVNLRDPAGDVKHENTILLAMIHDDIVYCIGFFPHRAWTRIEYLEIMQRNWPQSLQHARVHAAMAYEMTDDERAKMRDRKANVLTNVNGVVYGAIGGGYTAAGTSMRAHREADHALLSLDSYEVWVRTNAATIVAAIEEAGGRVGTPPTFRLDFDDDGNALAVETAENVPVLLGPFPL
jgi:hypothetical protein